jgi:hypothetical protein
MDPKREDNFFIRILEIPSQPFRPSDHHVSLQNCFVVPYEVYMEFIFTKEKKKKRMIIHPEKTLKILVLIMTINIIFKIC